MRANLHRVAAVLAVTTAIVALLPAGAPVAQQDDPDPNVTVQERARPEFDPIGIRAGSFFIYPEVTLGGLYDDNTRASRDDEESDFAATVTPRVRVRSNFTRHRLDLEAGGDLAYYQDDQDLNYQDLYTTGRGQLEITRDNLLNGNFGFSRLHEDPSSPDADDAGDQDAGGEDDDLTQYLQEVVGLNYRRNFARFYTVVGGALTRYDFQDGEENDRDRNQYLANVRAGYEISPRLNAFLQGTYDVRRYDETPDDTGIDRNSDGFSLRGGTEVDITGILFGEVGLGYNHRTYDDGDLDSVDGFGASGKLTWNVTPLTSIIVNGAAEIQETTVTFEGDQATADVQKLIGVDVTHELLRNVLLNANAAYVRDDFEGTDRADDTLLAGAGISYFLNRHLSLDGTYRFSTRDSDSEEEEFTRNIVRLGVTARL